MAADRAIEKRYGSRALYLAVAVGLVLILAGEKSLGKGLVLGTLFSILNFVLIGQSLPRRLGADPRRAAFGALGSVLFRFFLMAIPLYLGLRWDAIHFFAVVVGLFMVQLMILGDHLFILISTRRRET